MFFLNFRGLAGSEVLAAQLKCRGVMVSPQLSYVGITFDVIKNQLNPDFMELYDKCTKLVRN